MFHLLEFAPSVVNGAAAGSDPRLHLGQSPGYMWGRPQVTCAVAAAVGTPVLTDGRHGDSELEEGTVFYEGN